MRELPTRRAARGVFRGCSAPDITYDSCTKTHAEFRVLPVFPPAEVTRILGIQPTAVQNEGAEFVSSRKRVRRYKCNTWILSSELSVHSLDLRHHLDWVIGQLTPKRDALRNLQQRDGVKMTVYCEWWSRDGHGGPTLWPVQMIGLADLTLEFLLDVYSFGIHLKRGSPPTKETE